MAGVVTVPVCFRRGVLRCDAAVSAATGAVWPLDDIKDACGDRCGSGVKKLYTGQGARVMHACELKKLLVLDYASPPCHAT